MNLALALLTAFTLITHGYHPLAEDGGLYVAGVEYTLDHNLFPHYAEFVRGHLRFSVFAPAIAGTVRLTHVSLPWVLFGFYVLSLWLVLFATRQLLRRVVPGTGRTSELAQLSGIALFAAWATLPVAGTSLLLLDPYLTARSFSTPLTLLAIAYALNDWQSLRSRYFIQCCLALLLAALLHPLMAGYAVAFVVVLRVSRSRRRIGLWTALALAAFSLCALLQNLAPAESPAYTAAAITRYYWFLSQWQWFELLGLAGPLLILLALLRFNRSQLTPVAIQLCESCVAIAVIAFLCALIFAHESSQVHLVARLQVLRVYLAIYAIMAMLLGAAMYQVCSPVRTKFIPPLFIVAMAATMCFVQRQSFPASLHVELPGRTNPNPWTRAFVWARDNTPPDALFALDAKYVNTDGEDAQTFRATSLRSALPDYSKDGGEASITPALAEAWKAGADAQKDLSRQTDAMRDANLLPLGVTWMVLHSEAVTKHPCPYDNGTVKVCRLAP